METYSSKVRYFRLGRHALLAALNILQMRPGDVVLVPAFICRDLLAPIHALSAIPVFYEVDRTMRPVNLPNIEGVRALLAVNYFGFPQDLTPFRLYCKQHDAALIEDNAHGYFSSDETGLLLGSRGDLGIFSMRKTFALPDGAMLMVNDAKLQDHIPVQLPCRSESLSSDYWIKHGLAWIQRRTGLRLLMAGQDFARLLRKWHTGHAIAPLLPESEFDMPPYPAPHCRSIDALPNLDQGKEIARRRRLYGIFQEQFASLNIQPVFDTLPAGTAPYGYPFYAKDQTAKEATKLARKQGLDCINWPDLPAKIALKAPLHYRSLWMVNFIC